MAELRFFGYLSDLAGTRIKELRLEQPVTLRELVPPTFPETNVIVLINQKVGDLDSEIADQDTVILMPILSGG
ncbi:MAG TPA: MoaD/ThiS family protein [Thermodesulfobacteriota bacterium]|nr:MoaD/ThiS family protein [Thermodesulfobacteriota bacterium]